MSEEYYEEEYDESYYAESSYDEYEDVYSDGYEDGLEEGLAHTEEYEADYEYESQEKHPGLGSSNDGHPHFLHTMLGAAMGAAAAKSLRGKGKQRGLEEKFNLIPAEERALIERQAQAKVRKEDKRAGFIGFLVVITIIVLCCVCC